MQTHVLRLTAVVAVSVVGILAARPSTNDQPSTRLATSASATLDDAIDVLTVMHKGMVDYSQLGVDNGTDPTVKEFALMMVKDHGELLKSVQGVATKLSIVPKMSEKAADLNKEFQKDIKDLKAKANGKDFDKEFMDEQIDTHQETIDKLKDLDGNTKDASLKGAIAESMSKMKAHLERAELVRKKFG